MFDDGNVLLGKAGQTATNRYCTMALIWVHGGGQLPPPLSPVAVARNWTVSLQLFPFPPLCATSLTTTKPIIFANPLFPVKLDWSATGMTKMEPTPKLIKD